MQPLQEITARITNAFNNVAVKNYSFIINAIPQDIVINQNLDSVESVVSGMVALVVTQSSGNCIRINAEHKSPVVIIKLLQDDNAFSFMRNTEWTTLQERCAEFGGSLHVTSGPGTSQTISFIVPEKEVISNQTVSTSSYSASSDTVFS